MNLPFTPELDLIRRATTSSNVHRENFRKVKPDFRVPVYILKSKRETEGEAYLLLSNL